MSNLSTIRSSIKAALVINVTTYDSNIDEAIRSAIRLLQRKRYWFLQTTGTVTLLAGESSVSAPADFAMADKFYLIDGNYRKTHGSGFDFLEYDRFSAEYRRDATVAVGTPIACALRNTTIHFSHAPSANKSVIVDYYKKDTTLPTADEDISVWFGDEGYDLCRVTAQFIYEKEFLQGQPDPAVTITYQRRLDQDHERYERGSY